MFFAKLRKQTKTIVIVVVVAFIVTLLYAGPNLFGGGNRAARYVAEVNGNKIDGIEFQQVVMNLIQQQYQQSGEPVRGDMLEAIQANALQQLIQRELLMEQAAKSKIKVAKAEVTEAIAEIKGQFSSEDEFKAVMDFHGLTMKELEKMVEEDLQMSKFFESLTQDVTVSDAEIARAYEAVAARHILIAAGSLASEAEAAEALALATELVGRIRAGEDFATLAGEYSDDPGSAAQGGDLGPFQRGMMVPEFEEAAFGLAVGQVSDPVKSNFGYHIIEVTQRYDAEGEEFESLKEEIRAQLLRQAQNKALNEWYEGILAKAKITIYHNQLRGYDLLQKGDLDGAIKAYYKAQEEDPENPYILLSLGRAYERAGQTEMTLGYYESAADMAQTDGFLHFSAGSALLTLWEKAEGDEADELQKRMVSRFRKAGEYSPNDFYLNFNLYGLFQSLGMEEEAAEARARVEEIQEQWMQMQAEQDAWMQMLLAAQEAEGQE